MLEKAAMTVRRSCRTVRDAVHLARIERLKGAVLGQHSGDLRVGRIVRSSVSDVAAAAENRRQAEQYQVCATHSVQCFSGTLPCRECMRKSDWY